MGLSFHHAHSAAPTFHTSATSWLTVSSAMGMVSTPNQACVNQAEQQHEGAGDGRTADAWRTRVAAFHLFLSVIHHASLFVSVTVRFFSAALTASLTVLVMSDGFAPTDFARASSAAVWAFSYAVVLACT